MGELTKAQQRVFDFICEFYEYEGYPPSYSEIAQHFGFSSDGTVKTHLEILERKGFIERSKKARGIKILKFSTPESIPIIGQIAAGTPITAIENYIGTIDDINELKYKDGRIALTVKGDSMTNAGILSGDIAIIQTGTIVDNGKIGAVLIEDEATLKRIYYEKDIVRLKPENENYADILIDRKTFNARIIGKFIALIRK